MRDIRLLATAVLVSAGLATTVAAGTAAASSGTQGPALARTTEGATAGCGVNWGSRLETGRGGSDRPLTDVRTGRHACYDRMVFDIRGGLPQGAPSYTVRYVDHLRQDGSGRLLPVGGGAVLEIVVSAPSYDPATHEPTYAAKPGKPLPGVGLSGYRTFRDARFGASFEGNTQIGLGVRARLPFRVVTLGDRLVVDVAHTWPSAR